MSDAPSLLDLLNLHEADKGLWVGPPSTDGWNRVFGGQVLAQALAAACFTVEGRPVHSLHGYFLRPGKPGRPIEYEVSAVRDGQSFAARNVVGVQRDEVNFLLVASFQTEEGGAEFQDPMPDVPAPDTFPSEDERLEEMLKKAPPEAAEHMKRKRPIESIRIGPQRFDMTEKHVGPIHTWMKAREELVDDPNLHRCVASYASDFGAIEPCMRAIGAGFGDQAMQVASLDHAMWFHRPFRADDWLLYTFEAISVAGDRGLARGTVHDREGRLVASIAQEGVMRKRD